MKSLLIKIRKIICWTVCRIFPVNKRKIVISNYYGRGYGDNLKYITDRLLTVEEGKRAKIIWLVKNDTEKKSLPDGVVGCKLDTLASIYHLSTARVWIDNCRKGYIPFKHGSQFYIQTWHGGGAQKKCEMDAKDVLSAGYVKAAIRDSEMVDLMIADSRFMTNLYHHSFWYDGAVLESGYPRYDILLNYDDACVAKVYDYYGIDRDKALVLYAPTFRVDCSFAAYNIDFARLRANLKERFGKDFVVLVHLHPTVASIEGGIDYDGSTVINSTFYPDTQELIAVSHVLIGDYSSINYDFSLKRQPVFRYAADLEDYRKDRDLYFDFDKYPYPCAQNNDELEKLVLGFDEELYVSNLNAFFDEMGAVIKADSSEKIANLITDYIESKSKKEFFARNNHLFIYPEKK